MLQRGAPIHTCCCHPFAGRDEHSTCRDGFHHEDKTNFMGRMVDGGTAITLKDLKYSSRRGRGLAVDSESAWATVCSAASPTGGQWCSRTHIKETCPETCDRGCLHPDGVPLLRMNGGERAPEQNWTPKGMEDIGCVRACVCACAWERELKTITFSPV